MRHISILTIAIFFFMFQTEAQETFFKIYNTLYFDQSFDAIETLNGDYLIIGERALSYLEDSTYGYILKINAEGLFLQEAVVGDQGEWSRFSFIQRLTDIPDQYIIGGWSDSSNQGTIFNKMILQIIDEELSVQSKTTFLSPPDYVYHPWKSQIILDSLLYILSFYFPPGANSQIAVTKVRLPYDSINSYHSPAISVHSPYDLLYMGSDSIFQVFYIGPLFKASIPSKILQLDGNLNYITTLEGPPYILTSICATQYNDTSFLLTGSGISPEYPAKQHIMVYLMNNNNDTLKKLEYFNHPDTILYAGGGTNTVINGESIFVTGIYNFDPSSSYLWQTTPTWIQITKTDMDLNIISHHFYGGDALYIPYAAISTSDGGVLITGFTWDYTIPGNMLRDIFVLKVDTAGVVTKIPEEDSWQMNDAILCPNPGSDYCIAVVGAQHPRATLVLYDMNGRVIMEHELHQYQTRINTAFLPTGTYIYTFVTDGKGIGTGKWVKQ